MFRVFFQTIILWKGVGLLLIILNNVRQLSRVILDISRLQGITLPYVYNECFFYCSSLRTLCVSFQYLTFVGFLS